MSEVTEQQLEDMEALFVQTAASMTSDRGTITLHGLSPSTLYFADRPQRDVGHMSSLSIRRQLAGREQQLRGQPPNAVLSFAEPGDRLPEDAVAAIQDPHLDGDTLTYRHPSSSTASSRPPTGPCALFNRPLPDVPCHRSPQPGCTGGASPDALRASVCLVLPIGADGLAGQDHYSRVGACVHRRGGSLKKSEAVCMQDAVGECHRRPGAASVAPITERD